VGVDGVDLVATVAEPPVHDVRAVVLRRPGDAGHGDPLAGEELLGRLGDLHDCLLEDVTCWSFHGTPVGAAREGPDVLGIDGSGPGTGRTGCSRLDGGRSPVPAAYRGR
jgi:hypothetical protein